MINKRIKILKEYRNLLIECKKIMLSYQLSEEVENRFPTLGKTKQKVLTLNR